MNKYKTKELVSMVDYVLLRQKEWNSGKINTIEDLTRFKLKFK